MTNTERTARTDHRANTTSGMPTCHDMFPQTLYEHTDENSVFCSRFVLLSLNHMYVYDRDWACLQAHLRARTSSGLVDIQLRRLRTERLWSGGEGGAGRPVGDNVDRCDLTFDEYFALSVAIQRFQSDLIARAAEQPAAPASADNLPF